MIKTKEQLKEYIDADRKRYCDNYRLPWIIRVLLGEEQTRIIQLLSILRKYEYYLNTEKESFYRKFMANFYHILLLRKCTKMNVWLYPNVIGPGLRIVHLGGLIGLNACRIGKNCTVTAGVIIGKKGSDNNKAIIGDNVELTLGCKIIGNVKIGSNSVIAQNSVVIKDVPCNSIASGVPISIIKPRKHFENHQQ